MDLSPILNPLNDAQRAAVTAPLGPVLVLAGAGSGKTRVLTHRIAWLIQAEGVSPHGILAVTFTNKAAGEMRGRVERLLGVPGGGLWIGTFHGIAHRLLRLHWREANLAQGFQILDSEDQQRLIKKVVRAAELDETRWVPREVQWFINANKDEGRRPGQLKDENDPTRRQLIRLYAAYEAACASSGVVDFAELLPRAFRTTGGASSTCWSMSSRTPTPSSTSGSGSSPRHGRRLRQGSTRHRPPRPLRRPRASRLWWGTTTSALQRAPWSRWQTGRSGPSRPSRPVIW